MLETGMIISGFRVEKFTDVPDVNGRLWRMKYEKNGAELVWLERKDEVKTFVIAFKTLPEDDTGVAHILEHSVLSGSEKYPVKSPFDELRKSSLRVFMNAMTARDKTYYPFSTRNNQDFLNLAEVYLDAVFHPLAVKNPLAFQQEGWHYEIDSQTGSLHYNGVVYNEMKGVFADPEQTASREILHYLYPDTVYGNDSGGKPESIPHLTFEKFCAFYRKYYHPSNARIFLDGSIDLPAILEKLDLCLKDFSQGKVVPSIPCQKPVLQFKTIPYASTDCNRRTILADAWSAGPADDSIHQAALDILTDYLAVSNEAPLKQALLSQSVCEEVKFWISSFRQLSLVLLIRNTTDEQAATCREIVRKTLNGLVEDGLDHARLQALINKYEFDVREINSSRPRGLVYFSMAISHWLYDVDPAAAFEISNNCKKLREGVEQGLFEKLIKEDILENTHHVELMFSPNPSCGQKQDQQMEEELSAYSSSMSESDLAKLKQSISELKAFQSRTDSQEDKAKIPAIKTADIPREKSFLEHTIEENDKVTIIKTKPTCDGVVYISVCFPIDGLSETELVAMPLFAQLHGKLSTEKHNALALQTAISANVGRMEFSTMATERGNYLKVQVAVLSSKDLEAVQLLQEIIYETRFENLPAIEKIYRQRLLASERNAVTQGHILASNYAAKGCSRRKASQDILHGFTQLRWLQSLSIDDSFLVFYRKMAKRIFVREGAVVSFSDNISADAKKMLSAMFRPADGTMHEKQDIILENGLYEGLLLDGNTGFSGTAATLPDHCEFHGAMYVAAKILSLEYLHKVIREIGGAYGAALNISSNGIILCYTYRDPTPDASIQKIRNAGNALLDFSRAEKDLDRYITATIAGIDPYLSSAAEAFRPVELFLNMRTPADENILWQQVLQTTSKDLEQIAHMLQEQMAKSHSMVIGGANQLRNIPTQKVIPLHSMNRPFSI